ncbi:MAG: DUF805 domain-containing protein [Hyphomicrobiales bacterium]|nr:DUF805 domain-containing protein [Hyphomicrobiales bacterium]MCP4999119.1 DUF805 domain-containing protein [Hyphomicrobiales bacterium]
MRWFFFGLSGRIGRAPYILGTLLQIAIFAILFTQILAFPEDSVQFTYWSLVFFAYALVFVWIMVAMSVKRLHDMEIPGAVVLCLFVPVVSIIAFLVMCVWKGTDGPNDYGNDFNRPKT